MRKEREEKKNELDACHMSRLYQDQEELQDVLRKEELKGQSR